jgi:cytoskeletal protein CcmA (bactofilin family)
MGLFDKGRRGQSDGGNAGSPTPAVVDPVVGSTEKEMVSPVVDPREKETVSAVVGPKEKEMVSPVVGSREKEQDMLGDNGQLQDKGQANTYLGKGSQIAGKLRFDGTVRVDGHVEGEITAQESVLIGESATVKAQVTADSVVITGKVTGDITARRRVEIRAPGKLLGNITTPSLVIHDGVVFEGHCSMGGAEAQKADKKPASLPQDNRVQQAGNLTVPPEVANRGTPDRSQPTTAPVQKR